VPSLRIIPDGSPPECPPVPPESTRTSLIVGGVAFFPEALGDVVTVTG
jgi:hypothetical protein